MLSTPGSDEPSLAAGIGLFALALFLTYLLSPLWIQMLREVRLRHSLNDRSVAKHILAESRTLMSTTPIEPGSFDTLLSESDWPATIKALNPTAVVVTADRVRIAVGSGFHHFGVDCFAQGVAGSGDEELLSGLRFYSGEH